jgi:ATP-dependent DNA ligase
MWTKQKTQAQYSEDSENIQFNIKPMLAHTFDPNKPPEFPCYVQPKLDGVRLLVYKKNGTVRMNSRTGKSMDNNPFLQEIRKECAKLLVDDVCLDGELYLHGSSFEDIASTCRTSKSTGTDTRPLEYHVYDLICDGPFEHRYATICDMIESNSNCVKRVASTQVCSLDDFFDMHSEFVCNGYEGTIIRTSSSNYEQKRSKHLQKHKDFQEGEFVITGAKEGQGNDIGTIICECEVPSTGVKFWVRPRGDRGFRARLFEQKNLIIGKLMSVQYQNLTSFGVPRFPTGKCIRDYE